MSGINTFIFPFHCSLFLYLPHPVSGIRMERDRRETMKWAEISFSDGTSALFAFSLGHSLPFPSPWDHATFLPRLQANNRAISMDPTHPNEPRWSWGCCPTNHHTWHFFGRLLSLILFCLPSDVNSQNYLLYIILLFILFYRFMISTHFFKNYETFSPSLRCLSSFFSLS